MLIKYIRSSARTHILISDRYRYIYTGNIYDRNSSYVDIWPGAYSPDSPTVGQDSLGGLGGLATYLGAFWASYISLNTKS